MPSPEYFVVDRIEGPLAVVVSDDGRTFDVPRDQLPPGSHEGSVLRLDSAGSKPDWSQALIDDAERARRQREARRTLDKFKRSDPGGDVQL
jgi:hypothetical protein